MATPRRHGHYGPLFKRAVRSINLMGPLSSDSCDEDVYITVKPSRQPSSCKVADTVKKDKVADTVKKDKVAHTVKKDKRADTVKKDKGAVSKVKDVVSQDCKSNRDSCQTSSEVKKNTHENVAHRGSRKASSDSKTLRSRSYLMEDGNRKNGDKKMKVKVKRKRLEKKAVDSIVGNEGCVKKLQTENAVITTRDITENKESTTRDHTENKESTTRDSSEYKLSTARDFIEYKASTTGDISEYQASSARDINEYKESTARDITGNKVSTAREISEYKASTPRDIAEYKASTARDINEYKESTTGDITGNKGSTTRNITGNKVSTARDIAEYKASTARDINEYKESTTRDIFGNKGSTAREITEYKVSSARDIAGNKIFGSNASTARNITGNKWSVTRDLNGSNASTARDISGIKGSTTRDITGNKGSDWETDLLEIDNEMSNGNARKKRLEKKVVDLVVSSKECIKNLQNENAEATTRYALINKGSDSETEMIEIKKKKAISNSSTQIQKYVIEQQVQPERKLITLPVVVDSNKSSFRGFTRSVASERMDRRNSTATVSYDNSRSRTTTVSREHSVVKSVEENRRLENDVHSSNMKNLAKENSAKQMTHRCTISEEDDWNTVHYDLSAINSKSEKQFSSLQTSDNELEQKYIQAEAEEIDNLSASIRVLCSGRLNVEAGVPSVTGRGDENVCDDEKARDKYSMMVQSGGVLRAFDEQLSDYDADDDSDLGEVKTFSQEDFPLNYVEDYENEMLRISSSSRDSLYLLPGPDNYQAPRGLPPPPKPDDFSYMWNPSVDQASCNRTSQADPQGWQQPHCSDNSYQSWYGPESYCVDGGNFGEMRGYPRGRPRPEASFSGSPAMWNHHIPHRETTSPVTPPPIRMTAGPYSAPPGLAMQNPPRMGSSCYGPNQLSPAIIAGIDFNLPAPPPPPLTEKEHTNLAACIDEKNVKQSFHVPSIPPGIKVSTNRALPSASMAVYQCTSPQNMNYPAFSSSPCTPVTGGYTGPGPLGFEKETPTYKPPPPPTAETPKFIRKLVAQLQHTNGADLLQDHPNQSWQGPPPPLHEMQATSPTTPARQGPSPPPWIGRNSGVRKSLSDSFNSSSSCNESWENDGIRKVQLKDSIDTSGYRERNIELKHSSVEDQPDKITPNSASLNKVSLQQKAYLNSSTNINSASQRRISKLVDYEDQEESDEETTSTNALTKLEKKDGCHLTQDMNDNRVISNEEMAKLYEKPSPMTSGQVLENVCLGNESNVRSPQTTTTPTPHSKNSILDQNSGRRYLSMGEPLATRTRNVCKENQKMGYAVNRRRSDPDANMMYKNNTNVPPRFQKQQAGIERLKRESFTGNKNISEPHLPATGAALDRPRKRLSLEIGTAQRVQTSKLIASVNSSKSRTSSQHEDKSEGELSDSDNDVPNTWEALAESPVRQPAKTVEPLVSRVLYQKPTNQEGGLHIAPSNARFLLGRGALSVNPKNQKTRWSSGSSDVAVSTRPGVGSLYKQMALMGNQYGGNYNGATSPCSSLFAQSDAFKGRPSSISSVSSVPPPRRTSDPLGCVRWQSWKDKFEKRFETSTTLYIDTHCHLDFLYDRSGFRGSFAKYKEQNKQTFPKNFAGCVAVFCNPRTFKNDGLWRELLKEQGVWGAVGCHPKCATDFSEMYFSAMKEMLKHPKVQAVGEIGLDYSGTFGQHRRVQQEVFILQLKHAVEVKKPIVIHARDAEQDTVEILSKHVPKNYIIHRHCFTGSWEEADVFLTTFPNSYLGLTPLVTYDRSERARGMCEVAARIPLDKLVLETDAPYFVPRMIPRDEVQFSHPGMAITVADTVAKMKNISIEDVLQATYNNSIYLYSLDMSFMSHSY